MTDSVVDHCRRDDSNVRRGYPRQGLSLLPLATRRTTALIHRVSSSRSGFDFHAWLQWGLGWTRTDSNRHPCGYEPNALSIELRAHLSLSRALIPGFGPAVRTDGFEPSTAPLSAACATIAPRPLESGMDRRDLVAASIAVPSERFELSTSRLEAACSGILAELRGLVSGFHDSLKSYSHTDTASSERQIRTAGLPVMNPAE